LVRIVFVSSTGERREVDAPIGETLMRVARHHGVPGIEAQCGGACMCATCHVRLDGEWLEKAGAKTVSELETLPYAIDVDDNSRLSCQIKITADMDGMEVRVPETQV